MGNQLSWAYAFDFHRYLSGRGTGFMPHASLLAHNHRCGGGWRNLVPAFEGIVTPH